VAHIGYLRDVAGEQQLGELVTHLADGLIVIDADSRLLFANRAAERLLGARVGELLPFAVERDGAAHEVDVVTRDGSTGVAEVRATAVEWEGAPAFVAVLRDVTERKLGEAPLRRAGATLQAVVEASPLPIVETGPDFKLEFWNGAAERLFAEPGALAHGLPLPIARQAANQELFRVPERLERGDEGIRLECAYERLEGEPLQLVAYVSPIKDSRGTLVGMVLIIEETTERKQREREARADPLTGLANRRVLMAELDAAIERARAGWPGAFLLVDVDGFKEVNDELGHLAGDRVLSELSARLRAVLRPGDLLARYGGDELAVIPARATVAEARWIGERLRSSAEGFASAGGLPSISLSVGIVRIDGELDREKALEEADRALYDAKRQGRNRVVLREREPSSSDG
jgi:diguanylate cyclase (GGDEF)-like protein/PAS domain S-box-containing protein